jgi:putative membrane protein
MLFRILFLFVTLLVGLFTNSPEFVVLYSILLLVSLLYLTGIVRLWHNAGWGHGVSAWRAACFLLGMLTLALALSKPMDELTDQAFSMHMLQHVLLMKVIAPLLLLGEVSTVFLWAVSLRGAQSVARTWKRAEPLRWIWQQSTTPRWAWLLFAGCLWLWHIPSLYESALENETLHDFEHFLFLGTSLLFWWYLFQNGTNPKVRYGTAVLYLFTTLLHESALGALLTFSSNPWYSFYTSSGPWGLTPLADQQLAGVIMWLPGGVLFMALIVYYFGLWLQAIETSMPRLAETGDPNEK